MSPDHESSYYEIALTNRQVLTIFVVLLTCLVAAFLSGVWIGRRDDGQPPLQVASSELPAEQAAEPMTELNFFSEGGAPRDGRAEAPAKAPAKAPERGPAEPTPEQTPEPIPEPAAPTPAARDAKSASATPPATQPAPPPATKAPAKSPTKPPARAATPVPATAGGRVIQVFSTLDAEQADKLVRRLGDGGYPAYLVEESLQGRTTYRVRVGPYDQDAKARKIAEQLRRDYRLETWITSQPG